MYKLKSESGQFGESVRQFYSRDQERDPQHHQHGKGRLHMCRLHHRYVDVSCRRPLHGVDDPLHWQALATPQVVAHQNYLWFWNFQSLLQRNIIRCTLRSLPPSLRPTPARTSPFASTPWSRSLGWTGINGSSSLSNKAGKRSQSGWLLSFGAFTFLVPPCYQCNFLSNFLCHLKYHMTNIAKKERK